MEVRSFQCNIPGPQNIMVNPDRACNSPALTWPAMEAYFTWGRLWRTLVGPGQKGVDTVGRLGAHVGK